MLKKGCHVQVGFLKSFFVGNSFGLSMSLIDLSLL
jgi:hypothetical protein